MGCILGLVLVVLTSVASTAAGQTTVIQQGTEVDWQFAFIIAASLAAFLFLVVIVMSVYIKQTIKAHKLIQIRHSYRNPAHQDTTNTSTVPPSRQFAQLQRVSQISTSNLSSTASSPRRSAAGSARRQAWANRVSALDSLTNSDSPPPATEAEGDDDFNKILAERLASVSTSDAAAAANDTSVQEVDAAVAINPSTTQPTTEDPAGITDFDFGDGLHSAVMEEHSVHTSGAGGGGDVEEEDDFDWPQSDSDASDDPNQYDFTDQTVRLRLGTNEDTRVEEVQLGLRSNSYVDIQGVSRSQNSTAHSAGVSTDNKELTAGEDLDEDNDV